MSSQFLNIVEYLHPKLPYHGNLRNLFRQRRQDVPVEDMEVILDGWLVKLCDHRLFRKNKWNRYWFVLRHSGHLPGQFILEYYKDSSCHHLRGKIDLDQCDQVDVGLQLEYEYISNNGFDIQTPNKVYFLIADSEVNMNKWVGCICSVCGLKLQTEDDHSLTIPDPVTLPVTVAPSQLSVTQETSEGKNSSPYILISECFTGKPLPDSSIPKNNSVPENAIWNNVSSVDSAYDYPKPLTLPESYKRNGFFENNCDWYQIPPTPRMYNKVDSSADSCIEMASDKDSQSSDENVKAKTLPIHLGNNIFLYDDIPAIHCESDIETVRKEALELAQQLESLGLNDSGIESEQSASPHYIFDDCFNKLNSNLHNDSPVLLPPPRPPKPPNLCKKRSSSLTPTSCIEYSFPSSIKSKFISTNMVNSTFDKSEVVNLSDQILPSTKVPLPLQLDYVYDIPKPRSEDNLTVLLMSNCDNSKANNHIYSNAPPNDCHWKQSILDYEYTPTLTFIEETENKDKDISGKILYDIPPVVNRSLKPRKAFSDEEGAKKTVQQLLGKITQLSDNAHSPSEKLAFVYHTNEIEKGEDNQNMEQVADTEELYCSKPNEIQYLDLNLDSDASRENTKIDKENQTIVYKKVDFLRTKAFNETRQNIEAYRNEVH